MSVYPQRVKTISRKGATLRKRATVQNRGTLTLAGCNAEVE
jgi:hypothetical protein